MRRFWEIARNSHMGVCDGITNEEYNDASNDMMTGCVCYETKDNMR